MATVSRGSRLYDLAALVLIVAGAALWLLSYTELSELSKLSFRHPGPPNRSALEAADNARYRSYAGVAVIIAGCLTAMAGTYREKRLQKH